jgi:rod shape-determining protein MreC
VTELIRRHRLAVTSIMLLLVCSQLMNQSMKNPTFPALGGSVVLSFIAPIEKLYGHGTSTVDDLWRNYIALMNVAVERDTLLEKVKLLEADNSRLIESDNENQRLRKLLGYTTTSNRKGVAAAVIGRDPTNWSKTITIDQGTNMGVSVGLPVLDGYGIVGQIIAASSSASRVLLLTDNRSAIDAFVQQSRAQGIVEGMEEGVLILDFVKRDYQLTAGDRVVASGLDGVFPKGSLIGTIKNVTPSKNTLYQIAEVEPSVDTDRLENVVVLLPEK